MSREAYTDHYGHRGPYENYLEIPRPSEDPNWLDEKIRDYEESPVDVEALLAKRRDDFEAAWETFKAQRPRQAKDVRKKIDRVSEVAREREAVRTELTRVFGLMRTWFLRAGELTGLGEDIFFLTYQEVIEVLTGDDSAAATIPARRNTYERYKALPPLPSFIRGRFDPFQWTADPNRRSDIYDAFAPIPISDTDTIQGYAGSAGRVEGIVRRIDRPEDGGQLQPGEILVATTTNIGWTPIFPRAAAVVTDIGAALSHAAIVARELGIPAVVGCRNATMHLQTGDRVMVDGGRGIVEVLERRK
jgi:pyruvate,water dikinase